MDDQAWMHYALGLAGRAAAMGEVPVGAVLIKDDCILAEAWNQPIDQHDPTAHAEILVLRKAAWAEKNYRLPDTTLYVTLEPCLMCLGAMINARVSRLVFGARDKRFEVVKHIDSLSLNHQFQITGGILADECAQVLSSFFKLKRNLGAADIAE